MTQAARAKNPDGIRCAYGNDYITVLAKTTLLRLSPATIFMNRRSLPALLLGFALILMSVLPSRASLLVQDEVIKLPSGRIAKILSVSKIEYSKGVMALMVRYETTLSVDERKALSQEVDDVWKIAQKDVEHYGYDDAIISSNEVPKGIFITASHMVNFIYEKGPDGRWTRLNRADFMAAQ
jgi:hypothetical protein